MVLSGNLPVARGVLSYTLIPIVYTQGCADAATVLQPDWRDAVCGFRSYVVVFPDNKIRHDLLRSGDGPYEIESPSFPVGLSFSVSGCSAQGSSLGTYVVLIYRDRPGTSWGSA